MPAEMPSTAVAGPLRLGCHEGMFERCWVQLHRGTPSAPPAHAPRRSHRRRRPGRRQRAAARPPAAATRSPRARLALAAGAAHVRPSATMLGRIGAAVLALLTLAVVVVASLLWSDASYGARDELLTSLPDAAIALSFAVVGGVLVLKRPENLVGWALSLSGGGMLLGGVVGAYGELALLAKPELGLPAGAALAALSSGSWTPLMCGVFLLLVLFPTGHPSSPRWRLLAGAVPLGFALSWALISILPPDLEPPLERFNNPLAVSVGAPVAAAFAVIAPCLAATLAAAFNLVLRFRRSRGVE